MLSPFARTYPLENGLRVRLRLAWRGDAAAVADLLLRRDLHADDLEIGRLLTFDPVRRLVLCAFAPIDRADKLVGIGAIDLREEAEPDLLVVDERLAGDGLATLLGEALMSRAHARGRRVA